MSKRGLAICANRPDISARFLLVLTLLTPNARAASNCTPLRIEVNGKYVPAPTTVTLTAAKSRKSASVPVINGCFHLPSPLEKAKSIDVLFQANAEDIHITGMEQYTFSESWTVKLNDAFSAEFLAMLKTSSAKTVCVVELDPGDGDGTAMAQAGCRSPAK